MNPSPCVRLEATGVSTQNDADAGLARSRQQFLSRALARISIFGISLDDGAEILVEAVSGGQTALLRKAEPGLVCRLQGLGLQTLRGGQEAVCLDDALGVPAGCCQQARDDWHPPQHGTEEDLR